MPILSPASASADKLHSMGEDAALLFEISSEGFLGAKGKDAKPYLHRMCSNEIVGLRDGQGNHALYLTAKGRLIGELWVLQLATDELLIQLPESCRKQVAQRFSMFTLNDEVEIEDLSGEFVLFSLQGPKATAVLADLGLALGARFLDHAAVDLNGTELRLIRRPRIGREGFDLIVPSSDAAKVATTLQNAVGKHGGAVADEACLERLRIAGGVLRFGHDLTDAILPQEALLERTAISFDKGCYPGQETVAKIKYRGHVNRLAVRVSLGAAAAPGAEIIVEGVSVGELSSATELPDGSFVGLGFVKRDHAGAAVAATVAGAPATLKAL